MQPPGVKFLIQPPANSTGLRNGCLEDWGVCRGRGVSAEGVAVSCIVEGRGHD